MNTDLAVVLVLLAAAIAMFAINKPRMDAVALIMLTVLPLTGVISMGEALAGFSDSNIVLLGALFVIGEGLVRTGVAQRLGDWLLGKAGSSETRLLVLLMAAVAVLGAFMSSTGVVAIFIPVALRIAQNTGTAPSQLMMPLSVAALISGMMTLVATAPNLVVNSELVRHGADGLPLLQLHAVRRAGADPGHRLHALRPPLARRRRTAGAATAPERPSLRDWIEQYKLADREYRLRVTERSPLVGKTLAELDLRARPVRTSSPSSAARRVLQGRHRSDEEDRARRPTTSCSSICSRRRSTSRRSGSDLALEALPLSGAYFSDRSQEIGMAEVMVAADSELVGKTVVDAAVPRPLPADA